MKISTYIKMGDDECASSVIVYSEEASLSGDSVTVRGAYYGYAGGGVNEGGYFVIDSSVDKSEVLSYDDIEEFESSNEQEASKFNSLMQSVWELIEDDDGTLILTEKGKALFSANKGADKYMSPDFDGDFLSEISEEWQISLRFDD
jgi:hypothetical protein